ncbi:hypothetical protein [Cupriavidus campinensis]|uniref:hypothetical protein n=1 Tax=Cupriavidus campinensis TaxID=151783 RepID=UPI0011EDF3F9|nr:hypothetical protein [Cupriavidus campinensis]
MNIERRKVSTVLTVIAVLILVAALPSAVRDTFETGRIYLFSHQFLEELPQRFTGPGRMRFVLQPLIAVLLGVRAGWHDAHAGRLPYIYALVTDAGHRKDLLRSGLSAVRDLLAMGITLDALAQLLIYGVVHPGAAAVLGPVLICLPYAVARAVANRVVNLFPRAR